MADKLDEFHWHEALDRTHVAAETFDDHILTHPAIEKTEILKREAQQISLRLHGLYQLIGQISDKQS